MIKTVSIIGSGNVATIIGQSLVEKGIIVREVFSRTHKNASVLAEQLDAKPITNLEKIDRSIDLLIIAVKDDIISLLATKIPEDIPTIHTSGAISLEALINFKDAGIVYPFQTFSRNRDIDLAEVPFFIEANNSKFLIELANFTKKYLSENVLESNSESRARIHLAGVLSSNFTIQLISEAKKVLDSEEIPWQVLKPLVFESMKKCFDLGPIASMTGPAKRGDNLTIEKHLKMISDDELSAAYKSMSKLISGDKD